MDETINSQFSTVARLYAALMDRAPEASGMRYWAGAASGGATWESVAQSMLAAPSVRKTYPNDQSATDFLSALYQTLFNRAPDGAGLAYWTQALEAHGGQGDQARAWLLMQIVDAVSQPLLQRPDGMDEGAYAQTLADRAIVANKAAAGVHFATILGSDDIALASSMLGAVTADPASVQNAIDIANGTLPTPPAAPDAPIITSAALTNLDKPAITGESAIGTRVTVTVGGATYVVVAADGTWRLDLSTATPASGTLSLDANGKNSVTAFARTDAGGLSATTTQVLTIDTTAPDVPEITSQALTNLDKPVLIGQAEVGARVTIEVGTATYHVLAQDGTWRLNLAEASPVSGSLPVSLEGSNLIQIKATDQAGNTSTTRSQTLVVDTEAPTRPLITSAAGSYLTAPVLAGTAEIGASVAVSVGGATYLVVAQNGTWQVDLHTAVPASGVLVLNTSGGNAVRVVATDAAGNASTAASQTLDIGPQYAPAPTITRADDPTTIQQKFTAYPWTEALIIADDLSTSQWVAISSQLSKVANGGITGRVVFDSSLSSATALALLARYAGNSAQLDASGRGTAELSTLQDQLGKLASNGVTNLTLTLGDAQASDTLTSAWLAHADKARVNATNASIDELRMVGNGSDKLVDGGITGVVAITQELNLNQQLKLMGVKLGAGAQLQVDATNLDTPALKVVAAKAGQLTDEGISGRMHFNSQLSTSEMNTLIQHFHGTFISAHLVGMDAQAVAQIAAASDRFFGLTGAVTLPGSLPLADVQGLLNKYSGSTATLSNVAYDLAALDEIASSGKVSSMTSPTLTVDSTQGHTAEQLGRILAKSQNARVDILSDSDAYLSTIVTTLSRYSDRLSTDAITGDLTLSNAQTSSDLNFLLGDKTSAAARVTINASGMDAAKLSVIGSATAAAKIDSLQNLNVALSQLSDVVTDNLLSKSASGTALIDVSGATLQELVSLAANIDHVASNGISGSLLLSNNITGIQIQSLLGAKTADAALVQVNAASMTAAQLTAVASGISKVDSISNLNLSMQSTDDAVTAALLAKSSANSVRVNTSGASDAEVSILLGNLGKIANGGMSGNLEVSYSKLDVGINVMLSSKLAAFSTLSVDGTSGRDVMSFPGLSIGSSNLRIDPEGGGDLVKLGNNNATILIKDRASTHSNTLSANDTDINNLLRVEGAGTVSLHFSTAANAFGSGLTFQHGAVSASGSNWVDGNTHDFATLGDVASAANTAYTRAFGASTNQTPILFVFEIRGGSELQGRFLFLNDNDTTLDVDDLIMSYAVNSLATSFVTF